MSEPWKIRKGFQSKSEPKVNLSGENISSLNLTFTESGFELCM